MLHSQDKIQKVTSELRDEIMREALELTDPSDYRPVPYDLTDPRAVEAWRVCITLAHDHSAAIRLAVNGEVALGRGTDTAGFIALFNAQDAEQLGVSRLHALLRATEDKLYIVDLNSTNGTSLNGRSVGVNMPYRLSDGDRLTLGRMECIVSITDRRSKRETPPSAPNSITEALMTCARAILSELSIHDVLKQAVDAAMQVMQADEITIWLIDNLTGELFLEAERGLGDTSERIQRLPITDTLVGKVIQSGQPLTVNRGSTHSDPIKVKTGYLVEAVIYVPLTIGGITVGVLSAAQRQSGRIFTPQDEQFLLAVADMTAAAVHNARLFEATENALTRSTTIMAATNHTVAYHLKNLAKSISGYSGLLQTYTLSDDTAEIVQRMGEVGADMTLMIDHLARITTLNEDAIHLQAPCNLSSVVARAVEDMSISAAAQSHTLNVRILGASYSIHADTQQLYRALVNLIDNALQCTPNEGEVLVELSFGTGELRIKVRGSGPCPDTLPLHYLSGTYPQRSASGQLAAHVLELEFVRVIVEAHHGTLEARQTSDKGIEWMLMLPGTLRIR